MIAEHRARGRADDDLVRLRQCLQARRQVRRLADDRGLRCGSFADLVADDHRPGGDADPHRELDPGRPAGPRHSAPPSHRRCRDPPAPIARPRPHGRAGSRNKRGCRRPCTSRQSRRNAGSPHCTGSDTTRSHRANLRGPSRSRVRSIPPGRKTSRSAGGARPPAPRRPRPARRPAIRARWRGQAASRRAARPAMVGQRRSLGSSRSPLARQDKELAVEVGRDVQCTNQLAPDIFEGIVVEAETSLYPAIGDAALGDEAPEDLFQHPRKVHASAPVRRDLRRDLMSCSRPAVIAAQPP